MEDNRNIVPDNKDIDNAEKDYTLKELLPLLIKNYVDLSRTIKSMMETKEVQKETIKSLMRQYDTRHIRIPEIGDAILKEAVISKINTEKALKYFKEKEENFQFIHIKEYVDLKEVKNAIHKGQLDSIVLDEITDTTYQPRLYIHCGDELDNEEDV